MSHTFHGVKKLAPSARYATPSRYDDLPLHLLVALLLAENAADESGSHMARDIHLSESSVTVVHVALQNTGLYLNCIRCHRHRRWTPAQLAAVEPPWRTVWDFKRRRKCSRCGAQGSTEDIGLTRFNAWSGASKYRPRNPTPPQLWPPA